MKALISHNGKRFRFLSAGILLLILTVFTFSSCEKIKETFGKKNAEAAAPEVPVFAVNTTLAVEGQIQDYLAFSGDIIAGSNVDVYSDVALGKVTEIYVSVGQRVNRGDRILAVDPSRPGMTFRQSVAAAPITGTIISIQAQVGMTISQQVPLARISGGGGLEIRLNIAERFISRMAMNLPCEITLDAWPGEIFQGSVSEVSPTVDPASRTMEMRVNVTNAGSRLKPGMFAKVRVITEQKNNIVKIPANAMLSRFGEQFVYAVEKDPKNGQFNIIVKKSITPGIIIDGVMEVLSGLSPNEEIVVRGQTLIDNGSRVNVIERVSPLAAN